QNEAGTGKPAVWSFHNCAAFPPIRESSSCVMVSSARISDSKADLSFRYLWTIRISFGHHTISPGSHGRCRPGGAGSDRIIQANPVLQPIPALPLDRDGAIGRA